MICRMCMLTIYINSTNEKTALTGSYGSARKMAYGVKARFSSIPLFLEYSIYRFTEVVNAGFYLLASSTAAINYDITTV